MSFHLIRAASTTLTVGRVGLEQSPTNKQQHQRRSGSLESRKVGSVALASRKVA